MDASSKSNTGQTFELPRIETTVAAENFAKMIEKENQTYFLNGAWGSGKTDFLEKVKESSGRKFVTLDLWRVKDDRSVVAIAFSKLRPWIYWLLRFGMIFSVVISILLTDVVNIGLSGFLSPKVVQIAGVFSLSVAVWSFLKIKSDTLDIWLLNHLPFPNFLPFKKKVLIIDDFDRLSPQQQEQTYVLFNLIDHRIPVVFVGDYDKLSNSEGKYLQKIIDRKVELPFSLHPQKIWEDYLDDLETKLNIEIPSDYYQVMTMEKHNLREREQFNHYVMNELIDRNKLGHVQIHQQLFVIYLYLFYPNYYTTLLDGVPFEFEEQLREEEALSSLGPANSLHYVIFKLARKDRDGYPHTFARNPQGYFLYEQPLNMTKKELDDIIQDKSRLNDNLLLDADSDFSIYLQSSYKEFSAEKKNTILSSALSLAKESKKSTPLSFVIREKTNEIMPSKKFVGSETFGIPKVRADKNEDEIISIIYESWLTVLEDYDYDPSQVISLLLEYSGFSYSSLGVILKDELDISPMAISKYARPDLLLNVYISSLHLWTKFDKWEFDLWSAIDKLSDSSFLSFWEEHGTIESRSKIEYNGITPPNEYVIWFNKPDFEDPSITVSFEFVYKKLESRLMEMAKRDYVFFRGEERELEAHKISRLFEN